MTSDVRNILKVYRTASFASFSTGMTWYDEAHAFALSLDSEIARSAGVIAALSPMNGWANNKRKAAQLYAQGHGAGCGLYTNVAKAEKILSGAEPLEVLGGRKVRSFYLSILDPASTIAEPVIDRHAHDIAIGYPTSDKDRQRLGGKGYYDRFASAYIRAAERVSVTPKQLQAITWVEWRERIGKGWHG